MRLPFALLLITAFTPLARAERLDLAWPTPNSAYFEGRPLEDYIQPTASGEIESGLFGCRRSSGTQFHEAIDLKPLKLDRRGEATDPIFAVLAGVVRHTSNQPGNSNYGRYVVLEHPGVQPAVYTLYAHLSAIDPRLKVGEPVERGQVLGTMGRSSSGQAIPKQRAHLHLEIGLMLTQDFQRWYDQKKFGSRNYHGLWNGMNLHGFDPLDFFNEFRARRVDTFKDYLAKTPVAVRFRIGTRNIPDFATRYPALLARPLTETPVLGGWEVSVNATGLPVSLTPLSPVEMMDYALGEVRMLEVNHDLLKRNRCQKLVLQRGGKYVAGRDLQEILQLVFGQPVRN